MRFVALAALIACAPTRPAEPSVNWETPPSVPAAAPFTPPHVARFALPNGLQVLLAENHRLPLVALEVVNLAAGSSADGGWDGLAGLTADLLDEGAGGHDRAQFAAALEQAGARLEIDIASDASTLQLQVLRDHVDDGVALVADALISPHFAAEDLKRVSWDRSMRILEHRGNSRTAAAQRFDELVYREHPYAHPAEGDPDRLAFLDVAHVRAFHARAYGPKTTAIVVAGDIDRAALEHTLAPLAAWTNDTAMPVVVAVPPLAKPELAIVHRPDATTAVIVAGTLGMPGDAPDRIAAELANTAFGGAPTARLDHRFHDELNLSLAASSSFWRGAAGGAWAIATTVEGANAKRAIDELRAQIASAIAKGFTEIELATARTQLLRALPKAFESDLGTVHALARIVMQRLPDDYYATFAARLAKVTGAEAQRAFAAILTQPLVIAVVGDRHVLDTLLQ